MNLCKTILSGFIAGFAAAERAKQYGRNKRIYRFQHHRKKQQDELVQRTGFINKGRETVTPLEQNS